MDEKFLEALMYIDELKLIGELFNIDGNVFVVRYNRQGKFVGITDIRFIQS